jgi:hypothetical protein
MSEAEFMKTVCDILASHGLRWARDNGGTKGRAQSGLLIPGLKRGSPDLLVFPHGIEVFRIRTIEQAMEIARLHRDGPTFAIETKGTHRDSCLCESCGAQREWARRMRP